MLKDNFWLKYTVDSRDKIVITSAASNLNSLSHVLLLIAKIITVAMVSYFNVHTDILKIKQAVTRN